MIQNYSSTLFLNRKALSNNVNFIKSFLNEKTTLSAVIKGNAYGHGTLQILPALQNMGVSHFSVFSSYEAKVAFQVLSPDSTLMIMGDIPNQDSAWVVENEIDFFVFNEYEIEHFLKEARRQHKKLNIHIEIETGMNRHGFEKSAWKKLIELLNQNREYFNLKGMCTHFAGAESSSNFRRIHSQQETFQEAVSIFREADLIPKKLHTSCSAGILAFPDWNLDMVRVGILLYGLWPSKESKLIYKMKTNAEGVLKPVLSWHTSVMETKSVKTGEYIGYGMSYLAERDMKIASIPVGYGYGFSRVLSNVGRVLIKGRRLSVIGMVNMNMALVDVTDADVQIGDRVTLIGKDGEQEIKVSYFGNLSEQLNYELLTRLDKSIPRRFIKEI